MKYNSQSGYNDLSYKNKTPVIGRIDINSPVILGFTLISLVVLIGNIVSMGVVSRMLAVRYTSLLDPFMYIRMFTHIFAHSDLSHYTSNFLLILTIGPMVEEKYGSKMLASLIFITAVVTGIFNVILFPGTGLLGASGIVFMLIVLGSFTNIKRGTIPVTVILVSVIYIGNEVIKGMTLNNNISYFAHVLGGLCGAGFGYILHGRTIKGK